MKKNIKFLTILCMVLGLSFYSCEDDSTVANEELLVTPTEISVNFVDANNNISVIEGEDVVLNVQLSSALSIATTLDVMVQSGGADASATEVTYTSSFEIAAGSTSQDITLSFLDDGDYLLSDIQTYTVSFNMGNMDPNLYLISTDASRIITVSEPLPPGTVVTTTTGNLSISVGFAAGGDIDVYGLEGMLIDGPAILAANLFDASAGYSNPEVINLASGSSDGDYTIFIRDYNGGYPTDVVVTLDFAGGEQEVFNLVVDDAMFAGLIDGDVKLFINKASSGAAVTYTITQN
tara:strand:+ start:3166 stop:4041 length:876 start_codon:yes stop_codon:yes gene_type:complete